MLNNSLSEKNGYWYGVIYYKDQFGQNKQHWYNTKLKIRGNKKEAQRLVDEEAERFEKTIIEYTPGETPLVKNDIIFADYLLDYIESIKEHLSPNVYVTYMNNYKIMKNYFGTMKLQDMTYKHIEAFFDYLRNERGNKNSTVKHHAIIISPCLRRAYRDDLIAKNPCDFLQKIKKEKPELDFYNTEELNKLFDVIKGDPLELVILLTAYYGFRRSEVLGLKWDAINLNEKTISVTHKILVVNKVVYASDKLKTEKSRRKLPLMPTIAEVLEEHKKQIEENKRMYGNCYNTKYLDYICVDPTGDLIMPDYVTKHFNKLLKRNNLKHIRFHDLRHSCGSLLARNKVPMKHIQEWLGHANFNTTADIYSHLGMDSKLESSNVIDSQLQNESDISQEKIEIDDEEYKEFLEWKRKRKLKMDAEM